MERIPSYQESLWDVAVSCAIKRRKRICKNQFDSMACQSCPLYLKAYTPVNDASARLMMLQADKRARQFIENVNEDRRSIVILRGLLAAILAGVIMFALWIGNLHWKIYVPTFTEVIERIPKPGQTVGYQVVTEKEMWSILDRVHKEFRKKADVNHDSLTDCEDAAILFYNYYPYKRQVQITVNMHPTMKHAFNSVVQWDDKKKGWYWYAIEPQAASNKNVSYYMSAHWPQWKKVEEFDEDWTGKYYMEGWLE